MKTRIICDTMIWYELSKDRIKLPDLTKYELVCTYLSLSEIAFSPNGLNKLSEVQDTIATILKIKPEYIMNYPHHHVLSLFDSEFEYDREVDLVVAFLRVLYNNPSEGVIDNEFKQRLTKLSSMRKEGFTEWSDFLNEKIKFSRKISRILKRYHDHELEVKIYREKFIHKLNQNSFKTYSEDQVLWENFELHENVSIQYMRNVLLSGMKADRNDQNDLDNMLYVQQNDKYWTLEKRWITRIKEAKLEKFLYTD